MITHGRKTFHITISLLKFYNHNSIKQWKVKFSKGKNKVKIIQRSNKYQINVQKERNKILKEIKSTKSSFYINGTILLLNIKNFNSLENIAMYFTSR